MEDTNINLFKSVVLWLVQAPERDFSLRQLGVLLTCYLDDTPQTVRGLAAELRISKPAITRAADRLEEAVLLKRVKDPQDRRSVFMKRTAEGMKFMRRYRRAIVDHQHVMSASI